MQVRQVIVLLPFTNFELSRPSSSDDVADFSFTALIDPVSLTFDL